MTPEERNNQLWEMDRDFIKGGYENYTRFLLEMQGQILNWIFAVNSAGFIGLLTYASTKEGFNRCLMVCGLIFFVLGLVGVVFLGVYSLFWNKK